jgi:hypothetical protein
MTLQEQIKNYSQIDVESKIQFYPSRFNFLKDHFGLRPGMSHILLSTTGAGKSTIFRSIVLDAATEHDVMLYSSEESSRDLSLMFGRSKTSTEITNKIHLLHDTDLVKKIKPNNGKQWAARVLDFFNKNKCTAFFFDNLTTSIFYTGLRPEHQVEFWTRLETIFERIRVPLFVVAHTANGVSDMSGALILPDDIRANKTPTNRAQYCYCLQKFLVEENGTERIYPFIRVAKSRQHENQGKIYHLDYNALKKEYTCDRQVSYNFFNTQFINRFRLGHKK